MEYVVFMLCIFVIMLVVIVVFFFRIQNKPSMKKELLESEKRQQDLLFALQQQMKAELSSMQNMLRQDMGVMQDAAAKQIYTMEKNMHSSMQQSYETTTRVFGEVLKQVGKLDEGQKNLKELSMSISSIQNVLTDKKTRGIFGEVELYHLLENAMGSNEKQYAKQYRLSNGFIADAVIFGKEPLGMICIDSKFPLENYNRLMSASSKEERKKYHALFVSDVKKHIQTIQKKYIVPQDTAEFAYMFLPAEAIFSYIYAACDEVVKESYEKKVYLVSPTTLMAYITAIKAIYLGVERNENMAAMQKELGKLQQEFQRFEKRYQNVCSDFERCYEDMRLLQITAGKLVNRFHEIESVQLEKKEESMD